MASFRNHLVNAGGEAGGGGGFGLRPQQPLQDSVLGSPAKRTQPRVDGRCAPSLEIQRKSGKTPEEARPCFVAPDAMPRAGFQQALLEQIREDEARKEATEAGTAAVWGWLGSQFFGDPAGGSVIRGAYNDKDVVFESAHQQMSRGPCFQKNNRSGPKSFQGSQFWKQDSFWIIWGVTQTQRNLKRRG